MHVVAQNFGGTGLDLDARFQRADARRLGLAGEQVQQRRVLPAGADLQAHIPFLPAHLHRGEDELFFKVRQLGVADIDDQGVVPVIVGPVLQALHLHQRIEVHHRDFDHQRLEFGVDEFLQIVGRVDEDLAAVGQLHRFAQHRHAHGGQLHHELRRQEGQRVDLEVAKEDRGGELGQQRLKAAVDQRGQVDQVKQLGVGPADRCAHAPVVGLAAVIERAQHLLVAVVGQLRIGEDQLQAELGSGTAQERASLELHSLLGTGEAALVVAVDAAEEVANAQIAPTGADLEADIALHPAHGNGGQHDLALDRGHGRLEEGQHIADKALGRQQFVPQAAVIVVLLHQVERLALAHVAVNAADVAAGLVTVFHHHLVAKGQLDLAVAAAVIDLQVVAIALFLAALAAGGGGDHGVGHDRRCVVGLHCHRTGDVQGVVLAVFRLQDEGLRVGADHVGGQHEAGSCTSAFAAGLVAGRGSERGLHAGQHVEVAANVELDRLELGQRDQRVFVADLGAHQRINRFEPHVLRVPAHGVEGQRATHGLAARAHGGGVFGRDLGGVVGLHRQAAIGLHRAAREQGAARAEHDVVGNQGIDRHGAGGCGARTATRATRSTRRAARICTRVGSGCSCVGIFGRALRAAREHRAQA